LSFLIRDLEGHGEDLDPFALNRRDVLKFGDFHGCSVAKGDVGAQEVVVGGEENDQRERTVVRFKAAGWAHVELKGSVKAFDKLFEGAVGC